MHREAPFIAMLIRPNLNENTLLQGHTIVGIQVWIVHIRQMDR